MERDYSRSFFNTLSIMILEIITPNKAIYNGEAKAVQLPGKDGLFQILDNHAPIIAALKKGSIKLELKAPLSGKIQPELQKISDTVYSIDVLGGMVEMNNNVITVLAD